MEGLRCTVTVFVFMRLIDKNGGTEVYIVCRFIS